MKLYVAAIILFLCVCFYDASGSPYRSSPYDVVDIAEVQVNPEHKAIDEINDIERLRRYMVSIKAKTGVIPLELNQKNVSYVNYASYFIAYDYSTASRYQGVQDVLFAQFPHAGFRFWAHYLNSRHCAQQNNYVAAMASCDSALQLLGDVGLNISSYVTLSQHKARLYEKFSDTIAACRIYNGMYVVNDSLYRNNYMSNIDSLRVVYWIDQIKVENAEARNNMLTEIIVFCIFGMLVVVYVLLRLKNRNKTLVRSHEKLKEARKNASDSIQSKSMFLSNMSHELRTPLNAIVGFSGFLADNDDLDTESKEQSGDLIKQNADLLIKLINDIVDLSELNDRNISFDFESCDAVSLCRNVIDTVDKVKRTSAVVSYSTELSKLKLDTDPGRLQQVLINLLINATKFTAEGTIKLRLELSEDGKCAIFIVEDTGRGIPLDKQPNIFQRFEKLHEGVQGAGLGLSICKLIVDNVGGDIWIDSTYTVGARFIFTHPLVRQSTADIEVK